MHQKFITAITVVALPLATAIGQRMEETSERLQQLTARDDNKGCFDTSFGDLTWTIDNFIYNASYLFTTPSHQNSWGYASFDLSNPALTYKASCSASSNQLSDFFYGTVNYHCVNQASSEEGSAETTFAFNYPTHQLDINQTWTCADHDPQWPTTFSARGGVDLNLECEDTGTKVNPDWEFGTGSFYSTRFVSCEPVTVEVKPREISAVA